MRSEREAWQLAEANRALAYWCARRIHRRTQGNYELEDLEGAAVLQLFAVAQRFDESRGIKFSSFAVRSIELGLLSYVRRSLHAVKSYRGDLPALPASLDEIRESTGDIEYAESPDHAEEAVMAADVDGLMGRLDTQAQTVLALRLAGLTDAEIARRLEVSATHVRTIRDEIGAAYLGGAMVNTSSGRVEQRRPFECALCHEHLETEEVREVHMSMAHARQLAGNAIPCGLADCDAVFEHNMGAAAHRRNVHGVSATEAKDRKLPRGDSLRMTTPAPMSLVREVTSVTHTQATGRDELYEDAEARYDRAVFGLRTLYIRGLIDRGLAAAQMDPELMDRIEGLLWANGA